MVKIHKLKQPNKHSGNALQPGKTTEVKGLVITNKNPFVVHVDKFTRKPWKPSKAAKKKKAEPVLTPAEVVDPKEE